MMPYFYDQQTIGYLIDQFVAAASNAKDGKGLRLFVKSNPEEARSIIHTALAQYVGHDVLILLPRAGEAA